jgi:hypothetical protein
MQDRSTALPGSHLVSGCCCRCVPCPSGRTMRCRLCAAHSRCDRLQHINSAPTAAATADMQRRSWAHSLTAARLQHFYGLQGDSSIFMACARGQQQQQPGSTWGEVDSCGSWRKLKLTLGTTTAQHSTAGRLGKLNQDRTCFLSACCKHPGQPGPAL